MDIYRFINSADIARHLKDIRYSFSTLEVAWLIWQCKTITMEERHNAWRELIQVTSDCEVNTDHCVVAWSSLHQLLQRYMDLEIKLKTLLTEGNHSAVCFCSLHKPDPYAKGEKSVWSSDSLCASYSDALSLATNPLYNQDAHPFRIRKQGFDDELDLTGEFNSQGELVRIAYQQQWFVCGITGNLLTNHEVDVLCKSFDRMWFDFPVPFKKGDIVQDVYQREPFVLFDTDAWMKRSDPIYMNGRNNMQSFGYFYDHTQIIMDRYDVPYMDLEYCTVPLEGKDRILWVFSRFEKDEIDAWTLLKLFRMYDCEDIAAREHKQLKSFGAVD